MTNLGRGLALSMLLTHYLWVITAGLHILDDWCKRVAARGQSVHSSFPPDHACRSSDQSRITTLEEWLNEQGGAKLSRRPSSCTRTEPQPGPFSFSRSPTTQTI